MSMPFTDRTNEFRDTLQEKQKAIPETTRKRRKVVKTASPREDDEHQFGKRYLAEAYVILNHINTLTRMLASIRKPYLNVDSRSTASYRLNPINIDFSNLEKSLTGIRHLTNEDRDQIDLQARVVLSRCADRVKEMEALEKRRAELVASRINPLSRFLPARLKPNDSTSSSEFIAAHNTSITWYLNRRLAEASQAQKEMQEERVKRQIERTRTLGSGATREAMTMDSTGLSPGKSPGGESWIGGAVSSFAATLGATNNWPNQLTSDHSIPLDDLDDEDDDIELSQSQILQFEKENESILRAVQDTLESVHLAEARLMEISALQTELVAHLTSQTELTDQLYEDAIASTSMVEKGNVQLREARRRANDSRLFILVFIIGASLSLLFLHFY